ncbi:MAG: AIM24 family protein [Anaerolineales bacterium]|nr:AIM24 family protein [Anaerolineales bacterium]
METENTSNFNVLEQAQGNGTAVQILEYRRLQGSDDITIAEKLFFAEQAGMKLKQARIILNGGQVVTEAGALHFMKGQIRSEVRSGGITGLAKKMVANRLTQEAAHKPLYTGIGELFLEPTFGHMIIVNLNQEQMVVDVGMFYASEASVQVGIAVQKSLSSAFLSREGLFQTSLYGTGWAILASPVPVTEIIKYTLNSERLAVDGNFALLRKGDIRYTVEKSTKSWLGASWSGEGLLQTFTGTGEVWLAPTQSIYESLKKRNITSLTQVGTSPGQVVQRGPYSQ